MSLPLPFGAVDSYRAKYTVKSGDWGTIQQALPSVGANSTADVQVPLTSRFKIQGMTDYSRPQGLADPAAISIAALDVIAPVWPTSTAVTTANYIVVNGTVFKCTTAGTTAGSIPAGLSTRPVAGNTVSDNTAVWTSQGQKGCVLRIRFANSSAGALTPTAQQYDFYQF